MKNVLLIIFSLVALTLGQFEGIGHGIYLHDLILGLFIFVNVRNIRLALTDKTKKYGWYFVGIATLSLLLNLDGKPFDSTLLAVGYLARWVLYYLVFCLLPVTLKKNDINWLKKGLLVYAGVVLNIGLSQWLIFPDMRILSSLGWDDHYYRLIGSWLDPNFTGLILVLATVNFMSEINWVKGLGGLGKLGGLGLGLTGLFIAGVLLTYSRSSYIALLAGAIFLYRWKVGLLVGFGVGLVILVYAFIIPKPTGEGGNLLRKVSVEARIRSYSRGLQIFKTSPIYGVGFNYYKYTQEKFGYLPAPTKLDINSASGNDNSFIFILATTGIIGLSLFALFWLDLFIHGNHLIKASLAAITIHSFFNNSIFFPAVILWLWMIIGVSNQFDDRE